MDACYTGKQIAQRRKDLGLTQKMLAVQLNVTDKAVSKWERGLNFPDLGLMEKLADVLQTTPAALLGLEQADQSEVVSSMAQLSAEQLENARRDLRWIGWGLAAAAVLLVAADSFIGSKVVRKSQIGYQILQNTTLVAFITGFYLLFKYGEIRKWSLADWLIFYGAAFPVVLWNGIFFITGYSPNNYLTMALTAVGAALAQLLFYRIMRPKVMQALPALLTLVYMIRNLWLGHPVWDEAIAAICCTLLWIICTLKKPLRSFGAGVHF